MALPENNLKTQQKLADLHREYRRARLTLTETAAEPMEQFARWLNEALSASVFEPNAMTLATVDTNGRPSTRPVLIKSYDERGIVWYSSEQSRKGRALAAHPFAALQFYWQEMERVVRIEGAVERIDDAESDAYFASRPLTSRIGAWASEQSSPIRGRGELLRRAAQFGLRFGLKPPRPPYWGGYRLKPDYWEFWQGRASRLHDRIVYQRDQDGQGQWSRQRLAP